MPKEEQLGPDEVAILASRTDPARFAEVFERRAREVHRYLAYRSRAGDAEELTSETFARAFASRGRFDPGRGSARVWLYGVATNVLKHQRRSEARRLSAQARNRQLTVVPTSTEDHESRLVDRGRMAGAMGRLDEKSQDVIYLIGAVGMSYAETAAALGVPIDTVRSRYSRARHRLTKLLAPPPAPTSAEHVTRSDR